MNNASPIAGILTRRNLLRQAGGAGLAAIAAPAWASEIANLPFPGGPASGRSRIRFPQKGAMILQRARPPLLETPFEVFDKGVFTPNDQFFVRWHWAVIPTEIDVDSFRLAVHGHVDKPLSLSLKESWHCRGWRSPRSINVRAIRAAFSNRGWPAANGAMARWAMPAGPACASRTCSTRPGVKAGAVQVRFNGLDEPVVADGPDFMKSLAIDHARDGEVMIAYAMNGEQLPLLNGFPLRLVVPGWYATYWIKMLNDIEVLDSPDTNFWMKTAYTIPDTPHADMKPGQAGVKMVPINRMIPRSFITNLKAGADHAGRQADAGARHRLWRRRRRQARRFLRGRRQDLAGRDARQGRGQIQLPPLGRPASRRRQRAATR